MSRQVITGKAFEYAILVEFYERLMTLTEVMVIENEPYLIAQECFETFNEDEQGVYRINASAAVNFLLDVEPRLSHGISEKDVLQLEIASDQRGQEGDVRDVLFIRSLQKWEIGISAKNNHRAVKHSRLSQRIDFGKRWLGIPCSKSYFDEIRPVFDMLHQLRAADRNTRWTVIENMHDVVYLPVLHAFRDELIRLDRENPGIVAERLVNYLIGNQDFL